MKTISLACFECQNEFTKLEKHVNFQRKLGQINFYCSKKCANNNRNKQETLSCFTCSRKIKRCKSAIGEFVYCSRKCAVVVNNKKYRSGINNPNYKDGGGRFRDIKIGDICESCGDTRYFLLSIHHKDKNHRNNSPENRSKLCLNCHGTKHLKLKAGLVVIDYRYLTDNDVLTNIASMNVV